MGNCASLHHFTTRESSYASLRKFGVDSGDLVFFTDGSREARYLFRAGSAAWLRASSVGIVLREGPGVEGLTVWRQDKSTCREKGSELKRTNLLDELTSGGWKHVVVRKLCRTLTPKQVVLLKSILSEELQHLEAGETSSIFFGGRIKEPSEIGCEPSNALGTGDAGNHDQNIPGIRTHFENECVNEGSHDPRNACDYLNSNGMESPSATSGSSFLSLGSSCQSWEAGPSKKPCSILMQVRGSPWSAATSRMAFERFHCSLFIAQVLEQLDLIGRLDGTSPREYAATRRDGSLLSSAALCLKGSRKEKKVVRFSNLSDRASPSFDSPARSMPHVQAVAPKTTHNRSKSPYIERTTIKSCSKKTASACIPSTAMLGESKEKQLKSLRPRDREGLPTVGEMRSLPSSMVPLEGGLCSASAHTVVSGSLTSRTCTSQKNVGNLNLQIETQRESLGAVSFAAPRDLCDLLLPEPHVVSKAASSPIVVN